MEIRFYKGFAGILIFVAACGGASPAPVSRPHSAPAFQMCSRLDFTGVVFPKEMDSTDIQAFAVALNISGSYEGDTGWVNLTGDFDGQGLSMGLLNQNLGQGSLQPLLIKMRDRHPNALQGIFSPGHEASLLNMLSVWQQSTGKDVDILSGERRLSIIDSSPTDESFKPEGVSGNGASVSWALSNLYSGHHFLPRWEKEFTSLGQDPRYISIQTEAAGGLYDEALREESRAGVRELRAFLFFFDINVQNGGMYARDWADYDSWMSQNPNASATDKLVEILSLRLRHVKPRYAADVRDRKMTIIKGVGVVHGENRGLEREYCYDPLFSYR